MALTNPRSFHTQQVHYLRMDVSFDTGGIDTGVIMGTLPAGAQIIDAVVNVTTAFNAATTNVLTVGTVGAAYDNIVGAADVTEGTTGGYRAAILTAADLMSGDTDVYVRYTQTGAAATAGAAVVVIAFVPDNDK